MKMVVLGKQKDLESTLKEKVSLLLEEIMEKNWGIVIPKLESDITDKLKNPHLNIYIPFHLPFTKAKKIFKKEFLKRELSLHLGNVSQLAKLLGLDRRSIHRTIKELDIDIDGIREKSGWREGRENQIDQMIRSALDQYKELIRPQRMERIYEEVPKLSRNIAQLLPSSRLSWKEAEREFEKQFLVRSLQDNQNNITLTAEKIQLRPETLYRKVKRLGLRAV